MMVSVKLFAMLRERAGRGSIPLQLEEGATVADALQALEGTPQLAELLERMPLGIAVNREYAGRDAPLHAGDELALIPPVSGGATHVRVSAESISVERLSSAVASPRSGATVIFEGTTRAVRRLEYEAYAEMAERRIAAILEECRARHGLEAVAAEHRVGAVPLGEASVIVAVSAAHRAEAFEGAREVIDRIKSEAPIWKREVESDGRARWVEGSPVPGATEASAVAVGEPAPPGPAA